jgi:hypothetical protein
MSEVKKELTEQFWEWIDERPGIALGFAKELFTLSRADGSEDYEWTLLHEACSRGDSTAVITLVGVGFDINAEYSQTIGCTYKTGTPLTEAISFGAKNIVEYLLSFDHLNVRISEYERDDADDYDAYYYEPGNNESYFIPFNELFDTPFIERVIELGGTPNDYEREADSLLWVAFRKGDIKLLEKLINLGADTQIEGEYGPYIHMVLQKYFDTKDEKWIKALGLIIGNGVNLSILSIGDEPFMQRILQSHDLKLFELVGIEEDTLKEVAEYYEEPQPRLPYELLNPEVKADYLCRQTLPALMEGYYGWQIDKLIRILTLLTAAVEEELGQETPYDDELGRAWQNLEEVQINALLKMEIVGLKPYQQEVEQFIDDLERYQKLKNPSDRLMIGLEEINFRFKEKQKELGLEPSGLSIRTSC